MTRCPTDGRSSEKISGSRCLIMRQLRRTFAILKWYIGIIYLIVLPRAIINEKSGVTLRLLERNVFKWALIKPRNSSQSHVLCGCECKVLWVVKYECKRSQWVSLLFSSSRPRVYFDRMTCGFDEARRISTCNSLLKPDFSLATKWLWYWQDEFGNWNLYTSWVSNWSSPF